MNRPFVFVLSFAAFLASTGNAQGPTASHDLAIPVAVMPCQRNPPPSPPDSEGSVVVKLVEALPDSLAGERNLTARFDSSGAPLSLTIMSRQRLPHGGLAMSLTGVQFRGERRAVRVAGVDPDPTDENTQPTKTTEALTQDQRDTALVLAKWMWEHRCGGPNERRVRSS